MITNKICKIILSYSVVLDKFKHSGRILLFVNGFVFSVKNIHLDTNICK